MSHLNHLRAAGLAATTPTRLFDRPNLPGFATLAAATALIPLALYFLARRPTAIA